MSRSNLVLIAAAVALVTTACTSSHKTAASSAPAPPASSAPAASAITPAAAATTPAAAGLSGTWSGQYSGAFQGTFTLHWRQTSSRLSGTIKLSNPPTDVSLHGTVTNGNIRFGTVGSTDITYSGTVSGNSMSGTYKVIAATGSVGGPWSASRA